MGVGFGVIHARCTFVCVYCLYVCIFTLLINIAVFLSFGLYWQNDLTNVCGVHMTLYVVVS